MCRILAAAGGEVKEGNGVERERERGEVLDIEQTVKYSLLQREGKGPQRRANCRSHRDGCAVRIMNCGLADPADSSRPPSQPPQCELPIVPHPPPSAPFCQGQTPTARPPLAVPTAHGPLDQRTRWIRQRGGIRAPCSKDDVFNRKEQSRDPPPEVMVSTVHPQSPRLASKFQPNQPLDATLSHRPQRSRARDSSGKVCQQAALPPCLFGIQCTKSRSGAGCLD